MLKYSHFFAMGQRS